MKKLTLFTVALLLLGLTSLTRAQNVVINEFMASNDTTIADEHGEYDDWVELYNPGTDTVNIAGMYVTDDLTNPTAWQIPDTAPDSTKIPPKGFLLLWCDKQPEQGVLHVKLKLSGKGEQIGLFASDGTTPIDTLTFGKQETDVSYGRNPDGANNWQTFTTPTPGASNVVTAVYEYDSSLPVHFELQQNYPNPFNPATSIAYELPANGLVTLKIYDIFGNEIKTLVKEVKAAGAYQDTWNGTDRNGKKVSSGIYFYRLQANGRSLTRSMILLK